MEDNIDYLMNSSLCKHCEHRVVRGISSEGLYILNEFDEPEDVVDAVDGDLDDFIHISCSKLCIDLDHIVLDCTKFKSNKKIYKCKSIFVDSDILNTLDII